MYDNSISHLAGEVQPTVLQELMHQVHQQCAWAGRERQLERLRATGLAGRVWGVQFTTSKGGAHAQTFFTLHEGLPVGVGRELPQACGGGGGQHSTPIDTPPHTSGPHTYICEPVCIPFPLPLCSCSSIARKT